MAITLIIDTGGGSNFENFHLRNVQTLHVGGSGLAASAALQVSGVGSFGDGSAGAPGITFGGDLNTGIHRSAADTMQLITNGVARVTIDNTNTTIANTLIFSKHRKHHLSNFTVVGTGASTAEVDLHSVTLPIMVAGDQIEFAFYGFVCNGGVTTTVRLRLAGSLFANFVVPSSDNTLWTFYGRIMANGASGVFIVGHFGVSAGTPTSVLLATEVASDPSGAILKVTGQTANAAGEVECRASIVTHTKGT